MPKRKRPALEQEPNVDDKDEASSAELVNKKKVRWKGTIG